MLYALKGQRWELHAVYDASKKHQAIKDAKTLGGISTINGVKVVQEHTALDSLMSRERIIYVNDKIEPPKPKKAPPILSGKIGETEKKKKPAKPLSQNSAHDASPTARQSDEDEDEPAIYTFSQYLTRFFGIILFSVFAGLITSGITLVWLQETQLESLYQTYIIVALFFGAFFICVMAGLPMLASSKAAQNYKAARATGGRLPVTQRRANLQDDDESQSYADFREQAAKMTRTEPEDEAEKAEVDNLIELDEAPSAFKEQKSFVLSYLRIALNLAEIDRNQLDNFNKFGLTLFMAGACDAVSRARSLDTALTAQLVSESVKYIGLKDKNADNFSDGVQKYLLADPKYMTAFQNGRTAMKIHLGSRTGGFNELKQALEDWNNPTQKDESSSPVTILFTDIAGSTEMTQTLGDDVAQQVVRTHNHIVRSALTKFSGKEVKHTGDGIMASFSNTSNALGAAADMQVETGVYNKENPGQPLGLKIGLNTGEPIAEDDDLFGSTVQLAARIVDKAQAAQIFVSETVYGICRGKRFCFEPRGPFEMKGFSTGLHVHELMWNPDAPKSDPSKPSVKPDGKPDDKTNKKPDEPASDENQIILFHADIARYKRLMDRKDENTNARVAGALDYTVETIKSRGAEILNHEDGMITAIFTTATDAMKASVKVQTKLSELNRNISEKNQVLIRIGILVGDGVEGETKISDADRDMVNRLNSEAQPGGLCVTAKVIAQADDKMGITFTEGDDQPDHLYRWQPGLK